MNRQQVSSIRGSASRTTRLLSMGFTHRHTSSFGNARSRYGSLAPLVSPGPALDCAAPGSVSSSYHEARVAIFFLFLLFLTTNRANGGGGSAGSYSICADLSLLDRLAGFRACSSSLGLTTFFVRIT